MPQLLLFVAVMLVGGVAYAMNRGSLSVFIGQPVRFTFRDGVSSDAHMSRLRVLFNNVQDQGNGVYLVTPDQNMTVVVPEDAKVSGSTVELT
jgi:hypothetical protein